MSAPKGFYPKDAACSVARIIEEEMTIERAEARFCCEKCEDGGFSFCDGSCLDGLTEFAGGGDE